MRPQTVLEHRGRDVLAARSDDRLLLASGDRQIAVIIELTDVAGPEPAVVDRFTRRLLVVVVAAKDVAAVEQDLAVIGDPDRAARDRTTDSADLHRVRTVDRCTGRGLG